MKKDRRKSYRDKLQTGRGTKSSEKQTLPPEPRGFGSGRLPYVLEGLIRWGLVLVIGSLIAGSWASYKTTVDEVNVLNGDLTALENERKQLSGELNRFSDPEWREAHWKWLTMSHKPGEYYIEFIEPGDL